MPETTSPVAENASESHFVVGRPRRLPNWETECSSTMRPGSALGFSPGVTNHKSKSAGASPLAAYICQEISAGPGAFVGTATSIK